MDAITAPRMADPGLTAPAPRVVAVPGQRRIAEVSQEFEAAFLAEMLKYAGLGRVEQSFGGGPGEAAFTDFLIREYAREIARTRPLGIGDRVRIAIDAERAG